MTERLRILWLLLIATVPLGGSAAEERYVTRQLPLGSAELHGRIGGEDVVLTSHVPLEFAAVMSNDATGEFTPHTGSFNEFMNFEFSPSAGHQFTAISWQSHTGWTNFTVGPGSALAFGYEYSTPSTHCDWGGTFRTPGEKPRPDVDWEVDIKKWEFAGGNQLTLTYSTNVIGATEMFLLEEVSQPFAEGCPTLSSIVLHGDDDVRNATLIHTPKGDANSDGEVTFEDFLTFSLHYGRDGTSHWWRGDFDGDYDVDFADFTLLAENYGKSTATAAAVPEPSSTLLMMPGLLFFRRRR